MSLFVQKILKLPSSLFEKNLQWSLKLYFENLSERMFITFQIMLRFHLMKRKIVVFVIMTQFVTRVIFYLMVFLLNLFMWFQIS